MLYELRIYEVVPGKLEAMKARFVNHAIPLWKKHGIKLVGFWEPLVGTSNQLVYILEFHDMGHREKVWQAFMDDPEWRKARQETEKDGPLVARVINSFLRPTLFSPLQ